MYRAFVKIEFPHAEYIVLPFLPWYKKKKIKYSDLTLQFKDVFVLITYRIMKTL